MRGASLAVRDAVDEDRPALIGLMAALQAYEAAMEPNRAPPDEMAEPHLKTLEEWAWRSGGAVLVAAAPGAPPVAFAVFGVAEEFGCFVKPENHRFGVISDLYVAEPVRGQGLARALFSEIETRLAEAGVRRLEITALHANQDAQDAYVALGFIPNATTFAKTLRRSD